MPKIMNAFATTQILRFNCHCDLGRYFMHVSYVSFLTHDQNKEK